MTIQMGGTGLAAVIGIPAAAASPVGAGAAAGSALAQTGAPMDAIMAVAGLVALFAGVLMVGLARRFGFVRGRK